MTSEDFINKIFTLLYENRPNWMTVTEIKKKTGANIEGYQNAVQYLKDQDYVEVTNLSTRLFGSVRITDRGVKEFKK